MEERDTAGDCEGYKLKIGQGSSRANSLSNLVATGVFSLYEYLNLSDIIYVNWSLTGIPVPLNIPVQYRHFYLT